MWKIIIGFIAFSALALWMLSKGGDIDIGGEKHDVAPPVVAPPAMAPPAMAPPAMEKPAQKAPEKAPGK